MAPRFLRALDPIVLFVILGGALAALYFVTRPRPEPVRDLTIVVTEADVALIAEAFQRGRMRPPTTEELQALVERHVRDEMLYREAVAMELDREDPVMRRRIAMKLEYLAKDVGAAVEPTEAELQAHLDAHQERYALKPQRAFRHVYFSESKRGAKTEADAQVLLARLLSGKRLDPSEVGDPILLELEYPPSTQEQVSRDFGDEFAEALFGVGIGSWTGPLASGFGLHLVRVGDVVPGELPPLEAVRDKVRNDVLSERKQATLEKYLEALREKYAVEMRAGLPPPEGE